jgi:hypothetical protein
MKIVLSIESTSYSNTCRMTINHHEIFSVEFKNKCVITCPTGCNVNYLYFEHQTSSCSNIAFQDNCGIFHASSGNNRSANENAQRLSVSYFAFIEAERQAG